MPIQYKIDVLDALKKSGWSTYKIRKEKLMGEAALQGIRERKLPSWEIVSTLCRALHCQIGDLLEYIPDEEGDGVDGES